MFRVGIGYDVHPLVEGRELILSGVKIPFEKGLAGHSDADIVCHAVIDSILGALAEGDIGTHFPDSEQKYRNISSLTLLKETMQVIKNKKAKLDNIDLTIIAERPKLAPFTDKMKENISQVLEVSTKNISVKCSTNNGLGFIGKGEGMACLAVCLIEKED